MAPGIIGKKIKMTQIYNDNELIPVTVLEVGPCYVIQKKDTEKNGYSALQFGFEKKKTQRTNQPEKGHHKKAGKGVFRKLKEFRVSEKTLDDFNLGDEVKADIFEEGETVKVTGFSKGKGFSGVVKRWGFGGGRETHGSHFHRAPGSIGQCVKPGKIWKKKKMPGRHGNQKITVKNLKIVKVDAQNNIMMVKGAVPGSTGGFIYVKK
ncbi:MAG: 50S ribosomal protein L3 [bacterium]